MRSVQSVLSAAVSLLLIASLVACSDEPDAGPAPAESVVPGEICDVVSDDAVSGSFGDDLSLVDDLSGPDVCVFENEDGFNSVSVRIGEVVNRSRVEAVLADARANSGLTTDFQAVRSVPAGAEEAWRASTDDGETYVLAVRSGGYIVLVQAIGFGGDDVGARTRELAEWILDTLPESPFDPTPVARPSCELLAPAELAGALEVEREDVSVSPVAGAASCVVSVEPLDVSIEVHEPFGALTDEDLGALGRRRTVDGKEYSTDPAAVAAVGERAVWVAEPQSGASGDLYAVWGDQTLRLTVTGPTGDPQALQDVAVLVAPIAAESLSIS